MEQLKILDQSYAADLVEDWRRQIRASANSPARMKFMKTAKTCDEFFRGSAESIWHEDFRKNFLGDIPAPNFRANVAKAFELVAVMGPTVMWDYAGRECKPIDRLRLPPGAFPEDESGQQRYEIATSEHESLYQTRAATAELLSGYLNYSQREQPGKHALIGASHLAITDALVKGRGCLVTEHYKYPGSDRTLTGCFHMHPEDLFIDPGCRHADLNDCMWMARRHVDKYWKVEERFGLPKDSLKDKCAKMSHESAASNNSVAAINEREQGSNKYCDTIEWYEIWSKVGPGCRSMQVQPELAKKLQDKVGEYAYICIAESNVEYPLNYPPKVHSRNDTDEIEDALAWPVPYYLDGRWPIAMLDFYPIPGNPWPLAPMAMGLTELIFLNVIMSVLMERAYEASQSILVADKSLSDDLIDRLKRKDWSGLVEFDSQAGKKINELIDFVKTPDIKPDIFAVIDWVSASFDKRTGLTELLYGLNPGGKVSRSAADIKVKEEAVNTRTDWMQRCVEAWQTEAANLERIAAGWHVTGEDLGQLFGEHWAKLWDELIATEEPEVYLRQMKVTVEANSIRKPNKFRDNANLQQVMGYIMPLLKEYWNVSGDPAPLNGFIRSMGEAMDQDPELWLLPEVDPQQFQEQPDPNEEQDRELSRENAAETLRGKQLRNDQMERELIPPVTPDQLGEAEMPFPAETPPEEVLPPEALVDAVQNAY